MRLTRLAAVVIGVGAAAHAAAQPDTARDAQYDGCEPTSTVEFPLGTARLDLGAQSDLASAANWVWAEPGRYLMVVAPTGPLPGDAQLGYSRAMQAAEYLFQIGLNPRLIGVGTFEEYLTPSEHNAISGADSVVVLTCELVAPGPIP